MSGLGILISFILFQIVVAAGVIYVLKRLLDKDLLLTALERATAFRPSAEMIKPQQIPVISAGTLTADFKSSLAAELQAKFPLTRVEFFENSALLGGIVIEIAGEIWDHSVATRLKHLWG